MSRWRELCCWAFSWACWRAALTVAVTVISEQRVREWMRRSVWVFGMYSCTLRLKFWDTSPTYLLSFTELSEHPSLCKRIFYCIFLAWAPPWMAPSLLQLCSLLNQSTNLIATLLVSARISLWMDSKIIIHCFLLLSLPLLHTCTDAGDQYVLCASHPGVAEISHNITLKIYTKWGGWNGRDSS